MGHFVIFFVGVLQRTLIVSSGDVILPRLCGAVSLRCSSLALLACWVVGRRL